MGVNECFLEMNPAIDDYKQRGINVTTFGDPSSSSVHLEIIMMLILYSVCQILMFCHFKLVLLRGVKVIGPIMDSNVFNEESCFGDKEECRGTRRLSYAANLLVMNEIAEMNAESSEEDPIKSSTSSEDLQPSNCSGYICISLHHQQNEKCLEKVMRKIYNSS